jgi:hypothetical protein
MPVELTRPIRTGPGRPGRRVRSVSAAILQRRRPRPVTGGFPSTGLGVETGHPRRHRAHNSRWPEPASGLTRNRSGSQIMAVRRPAMAVGRPAAAAVAGLVTWPRLTLSRHPGAAVAAGPRRPAPALLTVPVGLLVQVACGPLPAAA